MKKIGVLVIVFSMLFTITIAPIFAETVPDTNPITSTTQIPSGDNTLRLIINGSVGNWNLVQADVEYDRAYSFTQAAVQSWAYNATTNPDNTIIHGVNNNVVYGSGGTLSSSLTNRGNFIFARQFVVRIQLVNNSNHAVTLNNYYKLFSFDGTFNDSFFGFDHIINNHDIMVYPVSNNSFYCYFNELKNFYPSGSYVMEANSIQDCIITFTQYRLSGSANIPANNDTITINVQSSGISSYTVSSQYDSLVTDMYTAQTLIDLNNIDSNIQDIHSAYQSNITNSNNASSKVSEVNNSEATLHQAELNYYQQNEQALNNVGLSNFSFDSSQSSGLGSVITDFTTLWNNIGPLQIIFTFTLSMSLATFLLRHKPVTGAIKKNQQK